MINKMCIFSSTRSSKVLHLHDFRKDSFIKMILERWIRNIAFVNIVFSILRKKVKRRNVGEQFVDFYKNFTG